MIHIPYDEGLLQAAEEKHVAAIISYVAGKDRVYQGKLFNDVTSALPYEKAFDECLAQDDWEWLGRFLLMGIDGLRGLTAKPERLQFEQFRVIYERRFSGGADKYVDRESLYNSYAFVANIDVRVCPYCDKEYLDVFDGEGGRGKTLDIDHFFPKSKYPALAMCFYNLVPSGQGCNRLKRANELPKSPYEADIESCTRLGPDLPIGVNMESVPVDDCGIKFHPRGGMEGNVEALALEERYEAHKDVAHQLLRKRQLYPDEKLGEMVRAGFFDSVEAARRDLFDDLPNPHHRILGKLRRDLLS